jgi:hypothetical protein
MHIPALAPLTDYLFEVVVGPKAGLRWGHGVDLVACQRRHVGGAACRSGLRTAALTAVADSRRKVPTWITTTLTMTPSKRNAPEMRLKNHSRCPDTTLLLSVVV